MARGRAGAEAEPHAGLDEIERPSGGLAFQAFAVLIRAHVFPSVARLCGRARRR